jgi:hypothetical protein
VRVFNAQGEQNDHPLASFWAYDRSFSGGVYVAAGDVNGDRKTDLITGAGEGGNPQVRVFDGRTGQQMRGEIGSFLAYDESFTGGVRVAAGYIDGDGRIDIVTSAGPGGMSHVRSFRARDRGELSAFDSYPGFTGGAYVASHGWIEPPPGGIVDPLEVYDAINGVVLRENVTEPATAGFEVELWANVWGGTVSTYSWDTSEAPMAVNVTGTSSPRLQFEWDASDEEPQIISVTTVNTDMTQQTRTITFFVEDEVDAGQPQFSQTQPAVTVPSEQRMSQEVVSAQYYDLSLNSGELYVSHMLPSYNPGAPALELAYSSLAADPRPIFVVRHPLDASQTPPSQVSAQLTLNSSAGSVIYYNTSAQNPGNVLQIALQGDANSLSTNRYAWSIEVKELHGTPITTTTTAM